MEAQTQGYATIGWAISAVQHGHKVRRKGWNGKGLWVSYVPAGSLSVPQKFGGGHDTTAALMMHTADDMLVPWLASQSDLLAKDWEIVDATQPGVYAASG